MNSKKYQENLVKAMEMLGKENTIFLGQTVEYPGSPMYKSLVQVDMSKRLEMPVFEDTQMGISIGLALDGKIPISIFPRIDFLICATNQLVNHLDKVEQMSRGQFKPGVIIRTQIGNTKPLDPGPQHCGDYTEGIKKMATFIKVVSLTKPEQIMPAYKEALERAKRGKSTLLIEIGSGPWLL